MQATSHTLEALQTQRGLLEARLALLQGAVAVHGLALPGSEAGPGPVDALHVQAMVENCMLRNLLSQHCPSLDLAMVVPGFVGGCVCMVT